MKKLLYTCLLATTCLFSSCDSLKNIASNFLSEADAANAIREALLNGVQNGSASLSQKGSFSRDVLLAAILPKNLQNVVKTLEQLGLTSQLDHFANSLDNAATATVTKSAPIFAYGIKNITITDAIGIVKNGGTSATDYLRNKVGDSLRTAVRPVMRNALEEYKIASEWDKMVAPVKLVLGNKANLNLGLDNILAIVVTNQMFKKIEDQEINIRTNASARTSTTLQRVFGKDWNANTAK
ncbi:DUF4197 domain-containing protein [Parasediminibacterium sp. JCM 36343]|uniref:DUF4197 domain-containing protein n=1 Tax=Parasediminibacterium sp. JCM 36343 TaxID=3374279 RepID=UPI00397BB40A